MDSQKNKNLENNNYEIKKKKIKPKCQFCNCKLGMISFTCKCGMLLCQKHLNPHSHNCKFDYVKEKKDLLEKNNPKLGNKLVKI